MLRTSAQVPELVDGLDLGSSVLKGVGVRLPPWAPSNDNNILILFEFGSQPVSLFPSDSQESNRIGRKFIGAVSWLSFPTAQILSG